MTDTITLPRGELAAYQRAVESAKNQIALLVRERDEARSRATQAEALALTVQAQRDLAEADARVLYEAARAYLDCSCSHGVHWVDVEGESEAEGCDLRIELDDRLRAFDAGEHPGAAALKAGEVRP